VEVIQANGLEIAYASSSDAGGRNLGPPGNGGHEWPLGAVAFRRMTIRIRRKVAVVHDAPALLRGFSTIAASAGCAGQEYGTYMGTHTGAGRARGVV